MAATTVSDIAHAFVGAAETARIVLSSPRTSAVWGSASALPLMTVADLAGHLFLVIRRVDKRLDVPVPAVAAGEQRRRMQYPRVDDPADLMLEVHAQVRADARRVAAWGWRAVRDAYQDKVVRLADRLSGTLPPAVAFGDRVIDLGEYLSSRLVEVLVHTDDLATSIDEPVPPVPARSADIALRHLLEAARKAHGDVATLRSFTRRERTPTGAPSIF